MNEYARERIDREARRAKRMSEGKVFKVYLGCYVLIPKQPGTVTRTINGCPICQKFLESNFCPKCGSVKGTFPRTYTQEKLLDPKKILEETGTSAMFITALQLSLTTFVLIPQEDLYHGCGRFIDQQTYIPLSFLADSDNAIKQEKARFMETFSSSLDSIQQLIPDAALEWGIVAFNDENY